LRRAWERGQEHRSDLLIEAVRDLAENIAHTKGYLGILVVVDELGKLLEHAVFNPEKSDVFMLQSLAELANRSGDAPVLLLTVLHQAFDRYAIRLGEEQRREWAKVQGRFEDVGFIERTDQMLRIVGAAIERRSLSRKYEDAAKRVVSQAVRLGLADNLMNKTAGRTLEACIPLHPTTALLLASLFRSSLAQNERSLFAFLTSEEPHGFQSFLRSSRCALSNGESVSLYSPDLLYDYVMAAMGRTIMSHPQGKRWAEVADAVDRTSEGSPLEQRLTKAVGVLSVLGDGRRLKASPHVLERSLADGSAVQKREVTKSLAGLKAKGILVYRHHSDSFAIWEGSDIDLDSRFQDATRHLGFAGETASQLESFLEPCSQVAKRHLYETGTLRYFCSRIVDQTHITAALSAGVGKADGMILYVLPAANARAQPTVKAVLQQSRKLPRPLRRQVLFAVPRNVEGVQAALREVLAWEWVSRNTPELAGDRIARKELAVRALEAQTRLRRLCSTWTDRATSYSSCHWIHGGKTLTFKSARQLAATLSRICNLLFNATPIIRNELVNRRQLSAAATAARSALMEHMITCRDKEHLGIAGTPPEMSMYISVLEKTRLHRQTKAGYAFGCPRRNHDPARIGPIWRAIDDFLKLTTKAKRPVQELLDRLSRPPYGLKTGLFPVLLLAFILDHEDEIALYESGSFVPERNGALFERLAKSPATFDIRRYAVAGALQGVLRQFSAILGPGKGSVKATVIGSLRPLFRFFGGLSRYTRDTGKLGEDARAVRAALATATDPHKLLFEELPHAVGMRAISSATKQARTDKFFAKLKGALAELERSYDDLLSWIRLQMKDAFGFPEDIGRARDLMATRATVLMDMVADLRLKAVVAQLGNADPDDRTWLEGLAAAVAGSPPKQWSDQDRQHFSASLGEYAGQFARLEELSLKSSNDRIPEGHRVLRVAVTDRTGREVRRIVHFGPDDEVVVRRMVSEMEIVLGRDRKNSDLTGAAIAELARRALGAQRGSMSR